jgi:glutathione S-transferase
VYFGAPVNELAFSEARPAIENGLRALRQLVRFEPYIAGDSFTFADIAAYFQLRFANLHTTKIYDWDITGSVPGLAGYLAMIGERPAVVTVDSVMQKGLKKVLPA